MQGQAELPTREELERDDDLRRKAAAIVSYVMAEGSVWLQKEKWGECAVNITFAAHETDLYEHFRGLCRDVFLYDIGPPQKPGNGANAIRGFIYSRFIAEWLIENGVHPGDKSSRDLHLPAWISESRDKLTWSAALQPWCDGEGCATWTADGRPLKFEMVQARHTDLDFECLLWHASGYRESRSIARGVLRGKFVFGIEALDYCAALCRSRILDDVAAVFRKLGFHPRVKAVCLFLKNDGNWSCHWSLSIPSREILELVRIRILTQERKVTPPFRRKEFAH